MNLIEKLRILKKNSNERKKLKDIVEKLPENGDVVKDILKMLKNNTTKVVFDKDIKNNYYTYLNDTIYLTEGKNLNKTNKDGRICVIAHECRHSMQSKILQNINFILSNIEIIYFLIVTILLIFKIKHALLLYSYIGVVILSLIPRLILEIDAVLKSVEISKKYLETKLNKFDVDYVDNFYKIHTKTLLPFFIFSLLFERILRSCIICTLYYIL